MTADLVVELDLPLIPQVMLDRKKLSIEMIETMMVCEEGSQSFNRIEWKYQSSICQVTEIGNTTAVIKFSVCSIILQLLPGNPFQGDKGQGPSVPQRSLAMESP